MKLYKIVKRLQKDNYFITKNVGKVKAAKGLDQSTVLHLFANKKGFDTIEEFAEYEAGKSDYSWTTPEGLKVNSLGADFEGMVELLTDSYELE
jgi:hypothetical protein